MSETRREKMDEKDETIWMSAKEVIAALEVSRNTVIRLCDRGVIARRFTHGRKRYLRADVEKLIAAQQAQTA
jgi:transposase